MGTERRHAETGSESLDSRVIEELVRRIVDVAQPERIILFGSAARGEMGPHSDVDLLVIKPGVYPAREIALQIRRALRNPGCRQF